MEASLRFYVDGLGFAITHQWVPRGKIEWCRIGRDGVGLMLQEPRRNKEGQPAWMPESKVGTGVSISFTCEDALAIYHEILARGIGVSEPFVGNAMWVILLQDPDGYRLEFQSHTDVPEETTYTDWKSRGL